MNAATGETWTHHEGIANGVRLHWVEQGSGPLVLLLHGFPEFWYSWRRQIAVLAERFHVVAPDLRGYNLSEKPPSGYDMETLTEDVSGLIQLFGEQQAAIVGHDWGGAVAWAFAIRHPESVTRLVVLNAPHPARFAEEIRKPRQLLRSWYILFFQIPLLPELLLGANRCWPLVRLMRRSAVQADTFSDEDLERYRVAMARPGALKAAIAYYRAAVRGRRSMEELAAAGPIQTPTLVLWGEQDQALGKELTYGLERWVPNLQVRYLDCGHWTQQERSGDVNRYLLEFLTA